MNFYLFIFMNQIFCLKYILFWISEYFKKIGYLMSTYPSIRLYLGLYIISGPREPNINRSENSVSIRFRSKD